MRTERREGSTKTGLAVDAFVLVLGGALFGVAMAITAGLRQGANAAALAFATAAARGPKDLPGEPRALAALEGASGFETSATDTHGQFSNGAACVTITSKSGPAVGTVVIVKEGIGEVVSYGLASACLCPARLRTTSRLRCSP